MNRAFSSNFGSHRGHATGSLGVGYQLFNADGTLSQARSTEGVYEIIAGSGIYAVTASIPSSFRGTIAWDTGLAFARTVHAVETINPEDTTIDVMTMLAGMSGSLEFLRGLTAGRWKIVANQMKFYDEDNVTPLATYNLYDATGSLSTDNVFERRKI